MRTQSKQLKLTDAIKRAGLAFGSRPWYCSGTFLLVMLIGYAANTTLDNIMAPVSFPVPELVVSLIAFGGVATWLLGELIKLGFKRSALKLHREGEAAYTDLLIESALGVRYLVAWLLFNFLVVGVPVGLLAVSFWVSGSGMSTLLQTTAGNLFVLALIALGVFFALVFHLYPYVLLDRKTGIWESLTDSQRLTHGALAELLLFYIIVAFVNIIGLLLFGVGLLVTLPITILAQANIYHQLAEQTFRT